MSVPEHSPSRPALFPEIEPYDSGHLRVSSLHKALPKSELWIIEAAGHSAGEPGIQAGLVRAVRRFE